MSESVLRERDAQARRAAKREFVRPLVLAAGAGTGKTTTLVARVVAWCLGGGWERAEQALRDDRGPAADADAIAARVVGRVVAITFTEAAAAEMARRVGTSFAQLASGTLPEGFDERAREVEGVAAEEALPADLALRATRSRALLGVLDQLVVRTIHAFCRRVLATHPLEAGVHPQFEIDADGAVLAEEIRGVVERAIVEAYDAVEPNEHWFFLAARGFGPAEIAEALETLAESGVSAQAIAAPIYTAEHLAQIRSELLAAVRAFFEAGGVALANVPKREKSIRVVAALERTEEILSALRDEGADAWAAFPEGLRRAGVAEAAAVVSEWAAGGFTEKGRAALGSRLDDVAAACVRLGPLLDRVQGIDPALFEHGRRALHPLLDALEKRLHARGVLGFEALLRRTRDLLCDRPEVAARLRRGIDQLLVDEFQDTDRVQCEILRALALEGPPDERPGLFLVGDPKQSIYGWRNADLAAYDAFVRRVVDGDGDPSSRGESLPLARNFRSAPPVLEAAQALLEPLFDPSPGVQPPFERLVPSETTLKLVPIADRRFAAVERWISCDVDPDAGAPESTTAARATEIEAEALARDLARLHVEHGIPWSEVAILLRALSDVDVYLEALRSLGIPYEVAKDRSYYRRREIVEAAALVRSVLDPNDLLALVTWLRSASVGVPDAAWVPFFARRLPDRVAALAAPDADALAEIEGLLREVAASIDGSVPGLDRIAGWEHSAAAALRALAVLRSSHASEAADRFVDRLRRLSGFELTESARPLGLYRVANLDRFFAELTHELVQRGDASGLLRRLRRDVREGREAEAGAPRESGTDAVQVLSIHAAKGLDFANVYCPQLHKGARSERDEAHATDAVLAGETVVLRLFGAAGPGWQEQRARREQRAEAERVRLLYVALTRAKRRLVLAGLPRTLAERDGGGSALGLLADRDAHTANDGERAARLLEHGLRHEDVAGVRCVLARVIADEPWAENPAERERPPRAPDASAVADESRRLADARKRAEAREARRRTAPASREGHEATRERLETSSGDFEAGSPANRDDHARARAKLRGTVVHRALELMDFRADPAAELERLAPALEAAATAAGGCADPAAAFLDALKLLHGFVAGALFPRVRAIADRIVARELPVCVDVERVPGTADAATAPVDAFVGTIDLLYRSAEGVLVVADWKTDAVQGETALRERAAGYAAQGRVYVAALQAALGLREPPRFELWFLAAGEVWSASGPTPRRIG